MVRVPLENETVKKADEVVKDDKNDKVVVYKFADRAAPLGHQSEEAGHPDRCVLHSGVEAECGGETDLVLVQVDVAGGGRVLVVDRHPRQALQHSPAALRSVSSHQSGRALTHAVQLLYNS